jgi:ABC-type lipoprotein release transport system permease subunit
VDLAASNRTDAVDRRTRMAIAALRGLAIGTVGTAVGVAIAYVATRSGLAVYNESGRLTEPTVLAPIPVVHPPSAMLGLVALPLIAAAIGAVVAAARPAGSRLTRAERLAW